MSSRVVSRFYVIYGDATPVYVGYTNRDITTRFEEHKRHKDFSRFNKIEVKEVGKIEFEFTWDREKINNYAKQVSDIESELINQYGTDNSLYQKGFGYIQGGQTWASVKAFVHSNKDNPKYTKMSSEELLSYLDSYRSKTTKLSNFISNYKDSKVSKLNNLIGNYQDYKVPKLKNFISSYQDPKVLKLKNLIGNYRDPKVSKLTGFISSYQDHKVTKIRNFINHYHNYRVDKLSGFINNYKDYRISKLRNFVSHYQNPKVSKLYSFVNRYKNNS